MKQSARKMISLRERKKYWMISIRIQVLLWKYGLQRQWRKLSMRKVLDMKRHLNLVSLSLIKIFLRRILVSWPRTLLKHVRLTKQEPRSLKVLPSIRTEGGFMLRSTKCVRIKEEQ